MQIVDGDLAELRVRRHGEPDGVHERFGIFRAAHERAGRLPRGGIGGAEDAAIAGWLISLLSFIVFFSFRFARLCFRVHFIWLRAGENCNRAAKFFCKKSRPAKQDGSFRIPGFQFMRQPH